MLQKIASKYLEKVADYFTYKVADKDTLTKLEKKFKVPVAELQRLNNIKNPNLIRVGDTLKIPRNKGIAVPPFPEPQFIETDNTRPNQLSINTNGIDDDLLHMFYGIGKNEHTFAPTDFANAKYWTRTGIRSTWNEETQKWEGGSTAWGPYQLTKDTFTSMYDANPTLNKDLYKRLVNMYNNFSWVGLGDKEFEHYTNTKQLPTDPDRFQGVNQTGVYDPNYDYNGKGIDLTDDEKRHFLQWIYQSYPKYQGRLQQTYQHSLWNKYHPIVEWNQGVGFTGAGASQKKINGIYKYIRDYIKHFNSYPGRHVYNNIFGIK